MGTSTSPAAGRTAAARFSDAPIRTCVGCRRRKEKPWLLRMVAREGTVVVDGRAPGRGAYVCPDSACLRKALDKQAAPVARALRRSRGQLAVDEDALGAVVAATAHGEHRREGVST